jgi:hypothetical protein
MSNGNKQVYPYNRQKIEDGLNSGLTLSKMAKWFPVMDEFGITRHPDPSSLWGWVNRNFKIKLVPR